MEEKLKKYVESMFEDAPKSKKANELKEEITANLIEKYLDLKGKANSEEDSYNMAIASIGNIGELIEKLKKDDVLNYTSNVEVKKKSALLIAIAVGLYICSFIPMILLDEINNNLGAVLMFLFWGVATALLVYNGASKPKYEKVDDTMVEEFKEWKAKKEGSNSRLNSVKSAIWSLIVAIYLIVSFLFGAWAYSWIIFIIGAAVHNIIDAIYKVEE